MLKNFEYNKDGQVFTCKSIDSVSHSNLIPNEIKEDFGKLYKRQVYFNYGDDVTKIGTVIGLEINGKVSEIYWIIKDIHSNNKYYILQTPKLLNNGI